MATFFLDLGGSFSPQQFRDSFKDGLGRPSLFSFRIKRYPKIWFSKSSTTGLSGLASSVLPAEILGASTTTLLNGAETLYDNVTGRGLSDLRFRVGKFSLPGKQLDTYTTKTYGPSTEFPREIENGNFNMSVFCSGSYFEHEFFSTWIDAILGYDNKKNSSTMDLLNSALTSLNITKKTGNTPYGFDVAYYDDIISEAELIVYDEEGSPSYVVSFEDIFPKVVGGIEFDWNAKNEVSEFPMTMAFRTMKAERVAIGTGIGGAVGSALSTVSTLASR